MKLRLFSFICTLAIALIASAQTEFSHSEGSCHFLGYDDAGNITFAVTGSIDYDMPTESTAGLKTLNKLLTQSAGLRISADGSITFAYFPGDNPQATDEATFANVIATESPRTAYKVTATISRIDETAHFISMKATSLTKSLTPDGYDIATAEYVNYNKDTDAIIDYFDVFNANAERRLREMMYPIAKKNYPLTISSPDDMELVENFAITTEGVTFCFPESAIAPASAGCPEISLTWQQLRAGRCLADEAESLLGK